MIKTIVRKNTYMDSIFLMKAGKELKKLDGVINADVIMGTDMNKTVLSDVGRLSDEARAAGPGDLIISLEIANESAAELAVKTLEVLSGGGGQSAAVAKAGAVSYPTVRGAAEARPEANLAVISVPGDYAAAEARKALNLGLNVFMWSDGVALEDEIDLKKLAAEKNLLMMGPGCGTSVINGVSLGIMSKVARGSVGIAGASGSGIQEVSCLITQNGRGISQAVGTGGRDLSKEVGGSTLLRALDFLEQDEATSVIVLISKPPHPDTAAKIYARVKNSGKPVVIFFLGGDPEQIRSCGAIPAQTLEQAAQYAVALTSGGKAEEYEFIEKYSADLKTVADEERGKLTKGQTDVRGLFCGGTHTEESILILKKMLGSLSANVNFAGVKVLPDSNVSSGNCVVDMGDEEFTRGKPHPVMDPSILNDRILREGEDPSAAVILFDVLLGYGAHDDPVGCFLDSIKKVREKAEAKGRKLCFIASVTGTSLDPQRLDDQKARLEAAGVRVMTSNAQAAVLAGLVVKGGN